MGRTMRIGVAAAVLAAAAVAGVAVPASADQMGMASGCEARVTQVRALDLQEPPQDEVYFIFGDTRFPSGGAELTFTALQTRLGGPTKFVPDNGSVRLYGWEADWPSEDDSLGSIDIACDTASPQDMVGPNSRSTYRIWFTQTPI